MRLDSQSVVTSAPTKNRVIRNFIGRSLTVAALICWPLAHARGSEIIRGFSPADGQLLYAADLDNLVDESVIGVQFFNDQQTTPVLGSGYYFLVLNPATETYYRMNAQQVLYGNTNMFLNVSPEAVPGYGTLRFYDPTNNWIGSTTISNLFWNSASNINVANLSFANTNNGGATNAFVLPRWPYPLSGLPPNGTNYPAHFIVFDTNGIPYRLSLSNAEYAMAFDLGTAFSVPYEYVQEFKPWLFYGTNSVSPYTNAFGWPTNFPVTAYYQTNISGTNLPTLTDTDTIPVNAWQQGVVGVGPTNTSATLYSIYQYLTNKNALPPYTIARAQFSGVLPSGISAATGGSGYGWGVTNMSAVNGIITNCALAVNWTNPQPVSFFWNQATPYTPLVYSNTLYWAQETNMPVLSFQIFTNYNNALARTNQILGANGYIAGYATLLWLTNYTSVNCAVIQDCVATTVEPGMYSGVFSTPAQTPYYYVAGSVQENTINQLTSLGLFYYTSGQT